MPIKDTIIEAVKHVIAKSVTVLGTYVVATNALPIILDLAFGKGATDPVQIKLLLLGAGYAIWQGAIIPVIEEIFNAAKDKITKTAPATGSGKAQDYFALI